MSTPYSTSTFNDRSLALQIVEATHAERTHVAHPKPSKKDSDAASVSSFGSSITLLKERLHSAKDSSAASTQSQRQRKDVLRNQVNIVG